MNREYIKPEITAVVAVAEQLMAAGSLNVGVKEDETYSGTAGSNHSGHFSIWDENFDEDDDF